MEPLPLAELNDFARRRFDEITKSPHELTLFTQGIGGPSAPSRLLALRYLRSDDLVVDWGCGPCVFARSILSRWPSEEHRPFYIGVDSSASLLALADPVSAAYGANFRRLPADRAHEMHDSAQGAPPRESSVVESTVSVAAWGPQWPRIVLNIRHVVEHLADPLPFLLRALELVRPDVVLLTLSQQPIAYEPNRERFPEGLVLTDRHLGVPRYAHQVRTLLRPFNDSDWWRASLQASPEALAGGALSRQEAFYFFARNTQPRGDIHQELGLLARGKKLAELGRDAGTETAGPTDETLPPT